MRCTSSSARRWCRSPATTMPVSYPQGILAEHRQCRESAVLFDVSHMGQLRLDRRRRRGGARDAGAGRHRRPGPRQAALRPLHQRRRRHPRRPDGDAARTTTCSWSSTPPARTPTPRTCAPTSRPRCLIEPLPERALLALQGPKAAAVMARLAPELTKLTFMTGGEAAIARHRLLRDPLRLHRRGRLRDLGRLRRSGSARPGAARRARGRARRPRRARHAAARGGPVPLRPRHRHHAPRRSRPASPGRSRRCADPAASAPAATRARR